MARGVERSETTRATAGDGPNGAIFLDRADSPGATTASCAASNCERLNRTCAPVKRPRPMPSGETAPLSASTGTGWGCGGSCLYACTIN